MFFFILGYSSAKDNDFMEAESYEPESKQTSKESMS